MRIQFEDLEAWSCAMFPFALVYSRLTQKWVLCAMVLIMSGAFASSFDVGRANVQIPAPEGLHEILRPLKELRPALERGVVQNTNLLAFYTTEDVVGAWMLEQDIPASRYAQVLVGGELEDLSVSRSDFSNMVVAEKRSLGYEELSRAQDTGVKERLSPDVARNAARLIREEGFEETVPLGLVYESRDAFATLSLTPAAMIGGNRAETDLSLAVIGTLIINGRVLYVQVVTSYSDDSDLDWIQSTATEWMSRTLSLNASTTSGRGQPTARRELASHGVDWDRVIGKSLVAGVLGGLAGLLLVAARRREK